MWDISNNCWYGYEIQIQRSQHSIKWHRIPWPTAHWKHHFFLICLTKNMNPNYWKYNMTQNWYNTQNSLSLSCDPGRKMSEWNFISSGHLHLHLQDCPESKDRNNSLLRCCCLTVTAAVTFPSICVPFPPSFPGLLREETQQRGASLYDPREQREDRGGRERSRGARGRRDWAAVVLLSGKHLVYPQHHLCLPSVSPSLSASVSLFCRLSVSPSPAVCTTDNIWVTADITLCHKTKTLTSNCSHFLGKLV